MSTAAATPAAPVKVAKKTSAKPKKVASHPKYSEMIKDALANLKERGGSSRVAILRYIVKKYQLGADDKLVNAHLKMALRAGIKNGSLTHSKGTGATGSFRIGAAAEKKTKAGKKPRAAGAKKPKVAKKSKAATGAGSAKKTTKKPKKTATAGQGAKVKKPKVAKKPKSPTKTAKPAAAKKPKAAKAAKAKKSSAAKPKKAAAKK